MNISPVRIGPASLGAGWNGNHPWQCPPGQRWDGLRCVPVGAAPMAVTVEALPSSFFMGQEAPAVPAAPVAPTAGPAVITGPWYQTIWTQPAVLGVPVVPSILVLGGIAILVALAGRR